MTLDPQLVALLQTLGPPLLAVVATLLGLIGSFVGFAARAAWRAHTTKLAAIIDRCDQTSAHVRALATAMKATKDLAHQDHEKMREAMATLEGHVGDALRQGQQAQRQIGELSTTVKAQQSTIVEVISRLSEVAGRLDAAFDLARGPRQLES